MSLEFTKIINDIQRMGRYLAYRDREELIDKALRILKEKGGDPTFVRERIRAVRESDVSGYRGAAPLPEGTPTDTPFDETHSTPGTPSQAILIAADGSQIYPDYNASSLYYVVNIGVLVYYHGTGDIPYQETVPGIFYTDNYMLDENRQVVSNRTVNSRRTIAEIRVLWQQSRLHRHDTVPTIALHDGNLLKFFGGSDIADSRSLIKEYMGLLVAMHDMNTMLAGYVDTPRSSYLVSLLHLLELEPYQITEAALANDGDLEGLTDAQLFERLLEPGERSAIMVQNSPTNYEYKKLQGQPRNRGYVRQRVQHQNTTYRPPRYADVGGKRPTCRRCAARVNTVSVPDSGTTPIPLCVDPGRRTGLHQQPREGAGGKPCSP
jgi:hypothetical protein